MFKAFIWTTNWEELVNQKLKKSYNKSQILFEIFPPQRTIQIIYENNP